MLHRLCAGCRDHDFLFTDSWRTGAEADRFAAAEAIAVVVARPLSIVSKIILPAVALLDLTTRLVLTLIGMDRVEKEKVTRKRSER